MKTCKIVTVILVSTFLFNVVLCDTTFAEQPVVLDVVPVYMFISDENGNPPASEDTPIFNRMCQNGIEPILDPDGNHVTLGQWAQVHGTARVKCVRKGTQVIIHVSGLIPKGVYSIWLAKFEPGLVLVGRGALGIPVRNVFIASESGEGQITAIHSGGPLSEFGMVDDCLLNEYEIHLAGAYHLDGQTHGATPGPVLGTACNWTVQFVARIRNE